MARFSAPRFATALLLLVSAAGSACAGGGQNNVASHPSSPSAAASHSPSGSPSASVLPSGSASPSAPAVPSPQPVTGAFGVLYGSQAASSYSVSIVAVDGKVVASAQASTPATVSCANAAAGLVAPPLSTSNTRLLHGRAGNPPVPRTGR